MAICDTWFSLGTVGKSISLFLGHPVYFVSPYMKNTKSKLLNKWKIFELKPEIVRTQTQELAQISQTWLL